MILRCAQDFACGLPLTATRLRSRPQKRLKKWRYKPHLVEGLPMEFETEVRLKFAPDSAKPKS